MKKIIIFVGLVLSQFSWAADEMGDVGRLIGYTFWDESSDTYPSRHMEAIVMEGLDGQGNPVTQKYVGGGTSCQQREVQASNQPLLLTALTEKNMRIRPIYKPGLGNIRCMVGFDLIQMPQFEAYVQ